MKKLVLFFLLLNTALISFSQKRINRLSINGFNNFYSLSSDKGYNNNVVRFSSGLAINYRLLDSARKDGLGIEVLLNTTNAYYDNVLSSGNILNVDNAFMSTNILLPIVIEKAKNMDHTLSVGLGAMTVARRDFYDKNNATIPFNATNFKKIPFGKYWSLSSFIDYEFCYKTNKKFGIVTGLRYSSPSIFNSSKLNYVTTTGNSLGFKFGIFYQFK